MCVKNDYKDDKIVN